LKDPDVITSTTKELKSVPATLNAVQRAIEL
jgi:hypothetical protein